MIFFVRHCKVRFGVLCHIKVLNNGNKLCFLELLLSFLCVTISAV